MVLAELAIILIAGLALVSSILLYTWQLAIILVSKHSKVETLNYNCTDEEVEEGISFIMPVRKEPLEYIVESARYIKSLDLGRYEIILVSDDDSSLRERLLELVSKLREEGVNIWLLWRSRARGFRTGALNDGLRVAKYRYIYVVDVDSRPHKNLLLSGKCILRRSPRVVAVVGRWEALNKHARISQALNLALKYFVNVLYRARSRAGLYIFPLGTGTLYDAHVLKHEMHGWDENRIQDDVELGTRLMHRGFSIVYIDEFPVFIENPNTYRAFRVQQSRWAYGALDALIARINHILKSPYSVFARIDAILYLAQYIPPALLFLASLVIPCAMLIYSVEPFFLKLLIVSWLVANVIYGVIVNNTVNEKIDSWSRLVQLGRLAAITMSASPYIARGVFKALIRSRESYRRTPKGIFETARERLRIPWELFLALFFSATGFLLLINGWLFSSLWLLLNAICYAYVVIRFPRDVFFS